MSCDMSMHKELRSLETIQILSVVRRGLIYSKIKSLLAILLFTRLSKEPLSGERLNWSKGDWEEAHQDVGTRQVGDEEVGWVLHGLISENDVSDEGVAKSSHAEHDGVETVEEDLEPGVVNKVLGAGTWVQVRWGFWAVRWRHLKEKDMQSLD